MQQLKEENKMNRKWKLRDVIMIAILGVVFAIIYLAVCYIGDACCIALAPFGLSELGYEPIYGVWFMAATLAAFIIQKPGVAIVAELLAAIIEMLLGNSGCINVVLTGIIQGAGVELAFAMFRYKKWNLGTMSLGAALSAVFIYIYELWYLTYYMLPISIQALHIVMRLASAVVFCGVVCWLACSLLARTGVVKSYAIGSKIKGATVYDEED